MPFDCFYYRKGESPIFPKIAVILIETTFGRKWFSLAVSGDNKL